MPKKRGQGHVQSPAPGTEPHTHTKTSCFFRPINPAGAGPGYSSGMVEKLNDAELKPRARPDHSRDWRPLLYEMQSGIAPGEIAVRLGLSERWVVQRLRREADSLPADPARRLALKLVHFMGQAEARLMADPAGAERTAKAILAMTKAARAVADFSAASATVEAGPDDEEDYRAVVERHLNRIAASRGEGADASSDESGSNSGAAE